MKSLLLPFALIALIVQFENAFAAESSAPLSQVADRALTDGKDAKLNAGFARMLGLKTDQPLLLKRLQIERDGATNVLDVLPKARNTIILSERRQSITTFYLTDRAGNLVKAVVNDGAVSNGGLTNLTRATAMAGFDRQKKLWAQQKAN